MLFDTILKTNTILFDWIVSLFYLLACGIIPLKDYDQSRSSMCTDLTDMIVLLLQTVQQNEAATPSQQQTLPNDTHKFSTVVKRLRVGYSHAFCYLAFL